MGLIFGIWFVFVVNLIKESNLIWCVLEGVILILDFVFVLWLVDMYGFRISYKMVGESNVCI